MKEGRMPSHAFTEKANILKESDKNVFGTQFRGQVIEESKRSATLFSSILLKEKIYVVYFFRCGFKVRRTPV